MQDARLLVECSWREQVAGKKSPSRMTAVPSNCFNCLIIASHGHPANSGLFQQAARNFERVSGISGDPSDFLWRVRSRCCASHCVGAVNRIAEVEYRPRTFRTSFGKARQVLLREDLSKAIERQRHRRQKRRRSSATGADRNLDAGDLFLLIVGLRLCHLVLLHFRQC